MGNKTRDLGLAAAIILLAAAAGFTAYIAPAEQQLGDAAKLIYLHAAMVLVSMLLVSAVGILGLLHLLTKNELFFKWSKPAKTVTLIFWFIYLSSSIVAMKLSWNMIIWNEPRFLLAAAIFLVLLAIFMLGTIFEAKKIISALNVTMGALVWILVSSVPAVMHPTSSPIRTSGSSAIKMDTLLIFIFLLAAAIASVILCYNLTEGKIKKELNSQEGASP
jgi:hypothetical protein